MTLLFSVNYACWRYAGDVRGLDMSALGVTPFLLASSFITMSVAGMVNNWAQMKDRRLSHMIAEVMEHETVDEIGDLEQDDLNNANKYGTLLQAVAAAAEAQVEWRAIQNSRRKSTICHLCCGSNGM